MIISVSINSQRQEEKRNIRYQLKDNRIKLKDIQERSGEIEGREGRPYHYNTVSEAFDEDSKYWNDGLINLAWKMIEEKMKNKEVNL